MLSQVRGRIDAPAAVRSVSVLSGIGQRVVSDLSQDVDVLSRTWTDDGGRERLRRPPPDTSPTAPQVTGESGRASGAASGGPPQTRADGRVSVSGPGYIGSMQTATTGDGRGASRVFIDANVLIQPLAPADVPAVRSLLVDLPLSYPGAEAWLERRLQDCLAERARCMIARAPDGVVGITILTPKALATKLSTIYVRPDFRRSGLGGRLLDQVLRDARGWAPRDARGETYVTVAHHTWGQLERLLLGRGFTRTAFEPNRYGQGRHEIVATRLG